MATLMERLKQLGIGGRPGERRLHSREEAMRTKRLSSIRGGETPTEEPLNVPDREMRSRFPVTGTQAQASLEPPRPRFPIPGTQALANIGLFTQRDPNPTVLPPVVSEQDMTNVPVDNIPERLTEEEQMIENGRLAEEAMAREEMLEARNEARSAAFGNIRDSFLDPIIEANNSTAIYDSAVEGFRRFDRGFQDIFDNKFNVTDGAAAILDDAVLEKENQKKQYEENLRQERDQQIKQEIFENSQRLTNDLIKNQIDKSKTQRASEDLMNLENQLQEAINQRDKTNFYLKHSGLFGQRRNSPSYTSVTPQSSFGPSSTYAQPEYYSGDPFEIKRLYE